MTTIFSSTLLLVLMVASGVWSISVPTGKETPITPAKPTPRPIYHKTVPPSAPVHEYTEENPEPPPLDPSYVPVTYKFINALIAHGHYYVPIRFRVPVYGSPAAIVQQAPAETQQQELQQQQQQQQEQQQQQQNTIDDDVAPVKPEKYGTKIKKPLYYVPKPYALSNVPTKGGYPKKAVAQPSEKQYWYYQSQNSKSYY